MSEGKEKQCLVKCGVCGWENYLNDKECQGKRILFLKCENCSAKGVDLRFLKPFERPIVIRGSFLNRFLYEFLMFWVNLKNLLFNFGNLVVSKVLGLRNLSRSKMYVLASIVVGVALIFLGWFVLRSFLVHLVLAAVSLVSGIISWSLSGEE